MTPEQEFERLQKQYDAETKLHDFKQVKRGMTHKTIAWIHPDEGDDYKLDIYSRGKLPDSEIVKILKRKRSCITNDYYQIDLIANKRVENVAPEIAKLTIIDFQI